MKNWKHCKLVGFWAILAFTVALVACDNGNNDNVQPKTFTVTFNADNGTKNTTQTVTEGGKATKSANPTKDGYSFGYWFKEATNSEWDFNTIITADITLKAKWIPPIVYVTGYYNDGSKEIACYWKDGVKTDLPAGTGASNANQIAEIKGSIYIAGWYSNDSGSYTACYWKDGVKTDIFSGTGVYITGITVIVAKQ